MIILMIFYGVYYTIYMLLLTAIQQRGYSLFMHCDQFKIIAWDVIIENSTFETFELLLTFLIETNGANLHFEIYL